MAVKTERLEKAAWKDYFDRVSKQLVGKQAHVEVASLSLGDQVEAEWTRLLGVAYDPKDDLLQIDLDGADHMIRHPKQIHAARGPAGLEAFEIVDADDAKQILRLREPLMLAD